jgi:ketosteroid isomerase-like protein
MDVVTMENVRVISAVYDAFRRGDVPGVLEQLDPEVEWRLAEGHPYSPAGDAWVGPSAVSEKFFARAGADWDDFGVAVRQCHDAGHVVVAEVRYSGRFVPTGRRLDAQGCHVWTVRGGKVAKFQQYIDTNRLRAVMHDG